MIDIEDIWEGPPEPNKSLYNDDDAKTEAYMYGYGSGVQAVGSLLGKAAVELFEQEKDQEALILRLIAKVVRGDSETIYEAWREVNRRIIAEKKE